ncbi:MAG: amidohydrolase [Clostridiales bacterium]|jgi:amidohydrolase|nr:amidohydrolase [Clostridiales bacterium]
MTIKPYIITEKENLISLRRFFHKHPEASMEEFETALKIEEELDRLGIEHKRVGETGVYGLIRGNGQSDRKIVLRADIDALRMLDQKTEEYASSNVGFMHACGHDVHMTALLGAAEALKKLEGQLNGQVALFFQQGEEFGRGARIFINDGLLDGASRVLGIHVSPGVPVGQIAITKGPVNASVDHFKIRVTGKSAHVSTPHLGIDALYIASQIVVNLQGIVSRQVNPLDTVVVGIGLIKAGTAYNIIAEEAMMEGTTRCFSMKTREQTNKSITDIAMNVANSYGAEAEVIFEDFTSPLINDAGVCTEVAKVAQDIVGEENIITIEKSLGGDDFAEYLLSVPGVYAIIGTGNSNKPNTTSPLHSNKFDVDEDGILIAANLYADFALEQLR